MFDIGFWELVLIAVIGIVVIGPNKLPEVVRTIALFLRKLRRMFYDVKTDIERELDLDNLRQQIAADEIEEEIKKMNDAVLAAEKSAQLEGKALLNQLNQISNPKEEDLASEQIHGELLDENNALREEFSEEFAEEFSDTGEEKAPFPSDKDEALLAQSQQHNQDNLNQGNSSHT